MALILFILVCLVTNVLCNEFFHAFGGRGSSFGFGSRDSGPIDVELYERIGVTRDVRTID